MKKILEISCIILAAAGFVWMVGVAEPTFGTFACGAALFVAGYAGTKMFNSKVKTNNN